MTKEKAIVGGVLAAAAGIIWLSFSGRLILYVHPDYVIFTTIMAIVAMVGVIGYYAFTSKPETKAHWTLVAAVSALALAIAVVPASSLTVAHTDTEATAKTDTVEKPQMTLIDIPATATVAETDLYKIQARFANKQMESIDGQYVKLSAYLYQSKEQPSWSYLTRSLVSCCVVDARDFNLLTTTTEDSKALNNSWVEVSGELVSGDDAGTWYYIKLASVTKIDEPQEPYLYVNFTDTNWNF